MNERDGESQSQKRAPLSAPATVPRPSRPPPPPDPPDEEFDGEKTTVLDHDDAPTQDYDPTRAALPGYDAGSRVAISSAPAPRASEGGRRRSSRRTVRMSDEAVARKRDESAGADETDAIAARAQDFGDEVTDEITVVKPLRIISIGSEPPPPIRSALATYPPHSRAEEQQIEDGWTPAAPSVAEPPATRPEGGKPLSRSATPLIQVAVDEDVELAGEEDAPPTQNEPDREDLVELEPDAAPLPAKRPPPPPMSARDSKGATPSSPGAAEKPKPVETTKGRETEPARPMPWWEDIFTAEYLRTHDRLDAKGVRREVDFIEESLGVEKQAVVLDLACGVGDHAVELAARGYAVLGFDYSSAQLAKAAEAAKVRQGAEPGALQPSFVRGDMRELSYEEAFDGAFCWGTSLGYFDDEKNLTVLKRVHRALRQGGMFLIDIVNREYVAPRSPSLVWFEGERCVCMDDMYVDFFTSRLRVKRTAMFEGGVSRELEFSIRLYTLHELGKLLHDVGFKVVEVTGHPAHPGVFFGTESPRLIVLAERV